MSKINEVSNKLYWLYIAGFFIILVLPLISISPWFSPPSWIQAVLFRSLLAILIFVYLSKEKINFQKVKDVLSPHSKNFIILISLLGFFLTVFISTLLSLDVSFSLWGSPMRGGGFINFSFLILFCLMCFMIVKDKDWKKLLDFSLIIGFLLGLMAIAQQSSIFNTTIESTAFRPSASLGNPIILALFLLPLFFLSLSFFISEQTKIKKYFYLFLTVFYAFSIVFITQTRAAILGLFIGLFWFLISYPKKFTKLKIVAILSSITFIIFIFFLSNNSQVYEKWPSLIKDPTIRITSLAKGLSADPSRISIWKISISAFFEKPYFGYGPENFYIAFNKHYDPTLPLMEDLKDFDRAHNSLIQILVDSGIFALIFYLIFFFSILWQLQKTKKKYPVAHGLQAGLIAYFIASLASIEGFAPVLIFFFFVASSMHLILLNSEKEPENIKTLESKFKFIRIPALIILFLILIIFLWQYNFVPIEMNKQLNVAQSLATKNWEYSYKILDDQSKIKTFFLPFTNLIYLNLLIDRIIYHPEENDSLYKKVKEISQENVKLQPYDYRNWLRLGESYATEAKTNKDLEIVKKSDAAFQKALDLNPKSPAIIASFFLANVSVRDFKGAQEKSNYCLKSFPESRECLWISGLINIYLNNVKKGKELIIKSKANGYSTESENSLNQLATAYLENKNYKEMLPLYQKLFVINSSQIQYKISTMLCYKELGNYQMAQQLAEEINKSNPELKNQIKAFLSSF